MGNVNWYSCCQMRVFDYTHTHTPKRKLSMHQQILKCIDCRAHLLCFNKIYLQNQLGGPRIPQVSSSRHKDPQEYFQDCLLFLVHLPWSVIKTLDIVPSVLDLTALNSAPKIFFVLFRLDSVLQIILAITLKLVKD